MLRTLTALSSLALTFVSPAFAQWPDRPLKLIVPFSAGSSSDTIARIIAARMGDALGQQIVIENRVGGSTVIGTDAVAKAAPDGYTLGLANTTTHAASAALVPNLPFDPVKDFIPIAMIGSSPFVLIGSTQVNAANLKAFVALAKAQPGKLSYASAGTGTLAHLAGELFKAATGTVLTHVPYKGSGPAMVDLIAGQIQMVLGGTLSTAPHIKTGRARALAVTSLKRRTDAPELPTLNETVAPGYEAFEWFAVFAPAGVPKRIVDRLHAELIKAANDTEVKDRLIANGMDFVGGTPAQLADTVKRDYAKWSKLIKETGLKAD